MPPKARNSNITEIIQVQGRTHGGGSASDPGQNVKCTTAPEPPGQNRFEFPGPPVKFSEKTIEN